MSLRIIYDNAADRATITATTTAAGLGPANLLTDIKGQTCRLTTTPATITLKWANPEVVGAVIFPMSTLGPTSTIRVRAYSDLAGTVLLSDTGVKPAAAGTTQGSWQFNQVLNANAFAEGFPPTTACYLTSQVSARAVVIDLTNPGAAFTDISRILVGSYFEPQYCADYGASTGVNDLSKNTRTAGGDLRTEWGPKNPVMQFDLGWIVDSDRARVRHIIGRGIGNYVFVSLFAGDTDPQKERDYSIYGKPQQSVATMAYAMFGVHTSNFQIEGF